MGKKLNMISQSSKDLQKMCKQLDLTMHMVISDKEDMITTGCGETNDIIHTVADGIHDLAEQIGVDDIDVLSHIIIYLNGKRMENGE